MNPNQIIGDLICEARMEVERMTQALHGTTEDQSVSMRIAQFRHLREMLDVLSEMAATIDPTAFATDRLWLPADHVEQLNARIAQLEAELRATDGRAPDYRAAFDSPISRVG